VPAIIVRIDSSKIHGADAEQDSTSVQELCRNWLFLVCCVLTLGMSNLKVLTPEQVAIFLARGVLVVEDILSAAEIAEARQGLHATLLEHGCDVTNLNSTGMNAQLVASSLGTITSNRCVLPKLCAQHKRVTHSRSLICGNLLLLFDGSCSSTAFETIKYTWSWRHPGCILRALETQGNNTSLNFLAAYKSSKECRLGFNSDASILVCACTADM
jgi:hypothetical protein